MLNVNGPAACGGNDTAVSHIKHRILPARIATVLTGASQPSAGFTVKVSGVCHHDGVLLQLVQRRLHFSPLVWWLVGHAEQRLEPFYTQKTRESWRNYRGERERERERDRGRGDGDEATEWRVSCRVLPACREMSAPRGSAHRCRSRETSHTSWTTMLFSSSVSY